MDTQEKIIVSALAQFYQYGFSASGVSLLAKKAGVTKRTLYAHFASKDDLILATLAYRHQQFMNQLAQYLQSDNAQNLIQSYQQFLQDWFASPLFFGCYFINACAEFSDVQHPCHQVAQQHKQAVKQALWTSAMASKTAHAAELADDLFLLGEGQIVASQVNGAGCEASHSAWQRLMLRYQ
jgi:AcrR family transcriptional regulator